MKSSNRGKSPATRKAVAAANLRRKVERLQRELGEISKTESDRLLAQSPLLLQTIFLLQQVAETDSPYAAQADELAEKLQGLLVGQAYTEAVAEGVIECPSGAYIV